MDLKGKKISVAGLGKSGYSIVKILLNLGADVFVSDSKSEKELLESLSKLDISHVSYESGGNTAKIYENKDLIILSPGISINHPIIAEAKSAGVTVISEVEMAYRLAKAPIIAVTGTNGKSTTVSLLHHLLQYTGIKSLLAGNIGTPLSSEVLEHNDVSWIVAEISSFQLEAIADFHPKISVLTNITPDHTDRHGSMEGYIDAKSKIFKNQNSSDFAVLNLDCKNVLKASENIKSNKLFFSTIKEVESGFYINGGYIFSHFEGVTEKQCSIDDIHIKGEHNLKNVLAMFCVAHIIKIPLSNVLKSLETFQTLHHRMELVGEIGKVSFYDDSKGTNPGAVIAAINSVPKPFALIAGGKDKNMDFTEMSELIAKKAKALIVIGEAGNKIADQVKSFGFDNIINCERDFTKAVNTAFAQLKDDGGSVLLSPACASFDMFKSAEHRGDEFERIVSEAKNS